MCIDVCMLPARRGRGGEEREGEERGAEEGVGVGLSGFFPPYGVNQNWAGLTLMNNMWYRPARSCDPILASHTLDYSRG